MTPRGFFTLAAYLLAAQAWSPAHGGDDPDGFREMKNGGQELAATLESLPYAAEGSGPIMYTFEFSECPYSQALYRDFNGGKDLGLELRRFFAPVSERSARETAALAKSRNAEDYHAFMAGRKRAPPFDRDNAAIDAYNAVLKAASQDIPAILHQNVWAAKGFVFPQYFWIEDGKVFANGGYLKDNFAKAVARARQGGGTPAAWGQASGGNAAGPSAQPTAAAAASDTLNLEGPDIVGLKLGMTSDEVLAAIRAHNPQLHVQQTKTAITMRDSRGRNVQFGEFLSEIAATWDARSKRQGFQATDTLEGILVVFSGPPSEPRAIMIRRTLRYPSDHGPHFDTTYNAITEKYGTPDIEIADPKRYMSQAVWLLDDAAAPSKRYLAEYARTVAGMAQGSMTAGGKTYNSLPPAGLESDVGPTLSTYVNTSGNSVFTFMLGTLLMESRDHITELMTRTRAIAESALAEHEREIQGNARQRQGPSL